MNIFGNLNFMEEEFTTSTGSKILYGIAAMVLLGLAAFCVGKASDGNDLPLLPAVLCAMGTLAIIVNLYKRRLVITDTDVTYTSIWGSRSLDRADVKGYRVGDKAIVIEPQPGGDRKIIVRDYTSLQNSSNIKSSLSGYFKDLNAEEYEASREEILHDNSFGATEEDRAATLKILKQFVLVFSTGAFGLFFVAIYLGAIAHVVTVIEIIYPLIGLALLIYGKGMVRLFAKKNSAYPSVLIGMLLGSVPMFFSSLTNADILDWQPVWVPALTVSLLIAALIYYVAVIKAKAPASQQIFFVLLVAAAYGFCSVVSANCAFDSSPVKVYHATVIDEHVSHGRSTSYHLDLGPWGDGHGNQGVTVSQSFYNDSPVNSQVNVNLKEGLLHIPWYYVTH